MFQDVVGLVLRLSFGPFWIAILAVTGASSCCWLALIDICRNILILVLSYSIQAQGDDISPWSPPELRPWVVLPNYRELSL